MTANAEQANVPVWTLSAGEAQLPAITLDGPMSAERLTELRHVLAALAERPVATLEAHPLPAALDRSRGIALDVASPLAQHLVALVRDTGGSTSTQALETGEVLYRFVAPAKVAKDLGAGSLRLMPAKDVAGGVRTAVMGAKGIRTHGAFVPVTGAASKGAVGGASAATGAMTLGTAAAVAAPLMLMAVAVAVSAHAEQQRRQAIGRMTDLLEQLQDDALDRERGALEGCRDSIDKATAILLDQGRLGVSLGLDSAVHEIGTALASAERRLGRWQAALEGFPQSGPVEIGVVTEAFPGIDEESRGRFGAHLELAGLAIALKRRVIVLQAVEHAQSDPANPFESFARTLRDDHERVHRLETGIAQLLLRLSTLELSRPTGRRRPAFTAPQVDRLLQTASRVRRLGDGLTPAGSEATDICIDIARERDGSLVVFPAQAA